jgi:hypothetical protein
MTMLTRQVVAKQLLDYMKHEISLAQLIAWAENSIFEGSFEPENETVIRNVVGKLGVADVNNFGLLWEDCEDLMKQLGYKVKVEAALVA